MAITEDHGDGWEALEQGFFESGDALAGEESMALGEETFWERVTGWPSPRRLRVVGLGIPGVLLVAVVVWAATSIPASHANRGSSQPALPVSGGQVIATLSSGSPATAKAAKVAKAAVKKRAAVKPTTRAARR